MVFAYLSRRDLPDRYSFRVLAAFFIGFLVIGGVNCTSRITRLADHGDVAQYRSQRSDDVFSIGATVEETPGDAYFWLNGRYEDRDLLVASLKIRNNGRDRLLIRRSDIVLTTESGMKFIPLSAVAAVDRVKGVLGVYRPLSWGTIHYGYHEFGFDDLFILNPGEMKAGYVFFHVRKSDYDGARNGQINISFSRFDYIGRSEYSLKLGR